MLIATAGLSTASASAATYGKLIARDSSAPQSTFTARFDHVRAPRSFVLVVTETTQTKLDFNWSVRCFAASHRASGGASGEASVSSGRWVKRVLPNWVKHPLYCTGSIDGSSGSSPVLVRVFVNQ